VNRAEAIDVVTEGLVGPGSLPVKLRAKEGLDRALLARVLEAMRFLIDDLRQETTVPKALATAFVDVGNSMSWAQAEYSEEEQAETEEAAIQIVDLAYELLAEPGDADT
jgi:hypothetical protein